MTQGYDVRKIESPLSLYCIKSQLIILLEVLYESFLRTENHLTEHVNLVSSQVFFLNLRKNVKIYRSTKTFCEDMWLNDEIKFDLSTYREYKITGLPEIQLRYNLNIWSQQKHFLPRYVRTEWWTLSNV